MNIEKAGSDATRSHHNVLILKGIVASDAFKILNDLLHRIREVIGHSTLQLWDIFSLICASGAAGYAVSLLLSLLAFAHNLQSNRHTHRSRTADSRRMS